MATDYEGTCVSSCASIITASDEIWTTWTDTTTNTTATCSTGSNLVWDSWNNGTPITSTGSNETIWFTWVSDSTDSTSHEPSYQPVRIYQEQDFEEMQRQREQREAERVEREIRAQILADEKEKAEVKAKDLLLDLIGKDELALYEETGHLFVKGSKNNYIIRRGGGIIKFNERNISELCFHLSNRYKFPDTDNVIAVKLAIEAMEDWVLGEANESRLRQRTPEEPIPRAACQPVN